MWLMVVSLLLLIVPVLSGCAIASRVQGAAGNCSIRLAGIDIDQPLEQGMRMAGSILPAIGKDTLDDTLDLTVNLEVENRNGFDLSFRSVEYTLFMDSRDIGRGLNRDSTGLHVNSLQTRTVSLPLRVSLVSLTRAGMDKLTDMDRDYELRMKVLLSWKKNRTDLDLVLRGKKLRVIADPDK